jgi:nicotinamidase-related amidase
MLKTKYEDIVNLTSIGKAENPIKMNDLLPMANLEQLTPATNNAEKILVIGIDIQQDFMDNGALGVPGAHKDVERFTRFIYNNMDKISQIAVSIDTHIPQQIFHPYWWIDENGHNPAPFTAITLADLDSGKWRAVINPIKSRDYVEHLEKDGKKVLVIWTYHCLQGTNGCALENQFANMVYFHSVAKKSLTMRLVKGQDPLSEMYGIIKPEYDIKGYINIDFLNKVETFDKIIIGGEAKSHCVLESIKQILENYKNRPEVTKKIFILEDCMSVIPSFEAATEAEFDIFKTKYKVNIVKSTDLTL